MSLGAGWVAALFWTADPSVTSEGGWVENGQALLVALAGALHGWMAFRSQSREVRVYGAFLALLCVAVLGREVDIDRLGSAAAWADVERVYRLAAGALVGIVFVVAYRLRSTLPVRKFLSMAPSVLTALAILLYFVGWSCEQAALLAPALTQLFEELFQLAGAVFFLFGAVEGWQAFGRFERVSESRGPVKSGRYAGR